MIKAYQIISDTNIGGAGKVMLEYLKNRNTSDFEHGVILPEGSLLKPEVEKLGVKVVTYNGMADKSFDMADVKGLKKLLKEVNPDIIHCHGALSARIAGQRLRIPVVSTRHSVFDQPRWKQTFPAKNILGAVNNYASDLIICVSPAAADNLICTGTKQELLKTVFNGISPCPVLNEEEKQKLRAEYNLKDSDFVCAIIARLTEVKGHSYLLQAAEILKEKDPDVKILMAGTGPEENNIINFIKENNLDNVMYLGFMQDVYKLENIMDLQLNCSYGTEATSISLLEGMSLGIPAAVSDFGGNPYVIRDGVNGVLFPKQNGKAIAKAILTLKNDKELYAELKANCIPIFEENFTGKIMASNIENIYKELTT